jgi:uncharacterized Tic20 family protein
VSVEDELDKLKKLHDAGTITDEQYENARAKLLAEVPVPYEEARDDKAEDERDDREERRPRRRDRYEPDEYEEEERSPRRRRKKAREWAMFLHLSLLAGHLVLLGGIIAPIIIWQTQKDEMPELDVHGKNAVNWIISTIIYALICIPLIFVVVGIPLLIVLGVLNIVFPIIAAVKANEGEVWRYPMTITFIK